MVIAFFGSEPADDPRQLRYYLERAFPETGRRKVAVVSVVSNSILDVETLNGAALAVVPARLTAEESAALKRWVAGGKTELRVMTNALPEADEGPMEVSEAAGDYALLGGVDFTHPIFAPFADPRFSDFSRIHFWKHRVLKFPANSPARVLAKFDDGSPALAQIPEGKGNILVLASGWNPADSQLALSTKFVPLLQTMLDWSGGAVSARTQFQIGEPVPAPAFPGDPVHWTKPNGKSVDQDAEQQIIKALPKMIEAAQSEELRNALSEHLDVTRKQAERLEKICQELGEDVKGEKCKGMEGVLKEGSELVKDVENEEVRDAAIIAAAQRVEHYEMAGYGTARTYATLLGFDEAASALEETLAEEKEADETLSDLAEELNAEALNSEEEEEGEEEGESESATAKPTRSTKSGGRKRVA